jgi:hypothetical protein
MSTLPSFREEFIYRTVVKMVIHKKHGKGKVVGRRFRENGAYITVEFEDGKVMEMVIPDSFEKDCVDAQGALKEEVDKALAIKRELQEKLAAERLAAQAVVASSPVVAKPKRIGRRPAKKLTIKSSLQIEYENYLIAAGYPVKGISGNKSTVPSYSRAVEKVIDREGITWNQLENDIASIIKKYDVGGVEEDFGNRSNRTNINALYRFAEMLDFKKI